MLKISESRLKMKRIKHNDLTHYFLRPHSELPQAYLASCEKFFRELKNPGVITAVKEAKAASRKRQAANGQREIIATDFRQFSTMLFSHWPLVYIVLMNTEFCKKNWEFPQIVHFHSYEQIFYFWFGQGKMMNANFSHFEQSYWVIVTITNADFIHTKHVKHF